MKVTRLAEQLATPMKHWLDKFIAKLRCLGNAPLEVLVLVADKFHVDADFNFTHRLFLL